MAVQAGMWAAARADVVGIVTTATKAYEAYSKKQPAQSGKPDAAFWSALISIGKVALGVAGVFVKNGSAIAKVTSLGTIAVSNLPTEEKVVSDAGESPEDIFNNIYKAGLAAVASQVSDVEERIYANAGSTMDAISSAEVVVRQNWQLPIVVVDATDANEIQWLHQEVSNICSAHVPTIVSKLDQLIGDARAQNAEIVGSVLRHSDLGHGHYGPGLPVQELNDMFCDLLGFFRNQVSNSGANLWAAYQYSCSNNDAAAATLATTAENLQALASPNGFADPWVYDATPPPTPQDQRMYREWRDRMGK